MNENNVHRVQRWFVQTESRLRECFPEVHCHVFQGDDPVQGKVNIQLNGPLAGASLSFWNKGDVQALVLDKVNTKEFPFDDRVLNAEDDVASLLQSYLDRLRSLVKTLNRRK